MKMSNVIVIVALALTAMACAPRRQWHHGPPCMGDPGMHGMAMAHGCGPESCVYRSNCFSSGATRSNDGVCQACSGGKWVNTTGCSEHGMCGDCHHCGKMKGCKAGPCHGGDAPCVHHKH